MTSGDGDQGPVDALSGQLARCSVAYALSRSSASLYRRSTARGAKVRSKKPPIPLAPSRLVVMLTRDLSPCGATLYVVTRLDPVSVSTSVRPGMGSLTCMRYGRVRPPAVILKLVTVPVPPPLP